MLLIDETKKVFDLSEIGRGALISGKHRTWDKAQYGIVTEATESRITVMFLPETQNIQNHYMIDVADVEDGAWTLRYSTDGMETVNVYDGGTTDGS